MRMYPAGDERREAELAALVREVAGEAHHFLVDGPQIATWILGDLWKRGTTIEDEPAVAAFLVVMGMATDAVRSARCSLSLCDFGGVSVQIRRGQELITLAIALSMDRAVAQDWLAGKKVDEGVLRAVKKTHPEVGAGLGRTLGHLSNEAHGRVQALCAYSDQSENFSWPIEARDIDRRHVWSAHLTCCAFMYAHMGILYWMERATWKRLRKDIRGVAEAYYSELGEYVIRYRDSGDWWLLRPADVRGWLLGAHQSSWEDRALRMADEKPTRDDGISGS
jgi:hypothetical protein